MKNIRLQLITGILISGCLACGTEFLDIKRDQSQVIPERIEHLQALLDDAHRTMNANSCHELGVIGADELELGVEVWRNIPNRPYEKNGYIWADDVYEGNEVNDWNNAYRRILYANTALEGIEKITPGENETEEWSNVKGSALFFRAFNYYQLAQLFCKPFDAGTADHDLGLPLRLMPDITAHTGRATVQQTYQQIIQDLLNAQSYLPEIPINTHRPGKAAVYALLARAYLQKGDYEEALGYADKCLSIQHELIDLNEVSLTANYTFPTYGLGNPEVIFSCSMTNIAVVTSSRMNIGHAVLDLYADHDLRKTAYFRNGTNDNTLFKGSYMGSAGLFTGLAVDEVLLIRAECRARTGLLEGAMQDLNSLLKKRHSELGYVPISDMNQAAILDFIMDERMRELVLRGTRWEDLRRLNRETKFARTINRILAEDRYTLVPNDSKYVWPLPDNVIELGGYIQNER